MQHDCRAVRERKFFQQLHEFLLLLFPDEKLERRRLAGGRFELSAEFSLAITPSPLLNALLVRDAEQPTPELVVIAQRAKMSEGVEECFLNEVEARLFVAHQFEDVHIQWQPVTLEERRPRLGVAGPRVGHGQLFAFRHCEHLHPAECRGREKVQSHYRNAANRCRISSSIATGLATVWAISSRKSFR